MIFQYAWLKFTDQKTLSSSLCRLTCVMIHPIRLVTRLELKFNLFYTAGREAISN